MHNASYLIRSRHAIYYFRYPIPAHNGKRISLSLGTRCPREALRLAKALEYHAYMITNKVEIAQLDYAEVKEVLKNHFGAVLERMKRNIDKDGPLPLERSQALQKLKDEAQYAIDNDQDELHEHLFPAGGIPEEISLDKTIEPIAKEHGISLDHDRRTRTALRREYKHALNSYLDAALSYNNSAGYYDYSSPAPVPVPAPTSTASYTDNTELRLENIITKYLEEDTDLNRRGYRDKRDCLNYLLEVLGADYLITDVHYTDVRMVKDTLVATPSNRSKKVKIRGLPLEQQIEIAKKLQLDLFSDTNVNKHLGYMSGLFKWAKQNKYIHENPFEGIQVRVDKKKVRRVAFKKDEVRHILQAASQIDKDKPLNKTRYWALLLYVYTGARLNEIASLTPNDIKQYNGIWYLSITDEGETKQIKTHAARRLVPIHSELLRLGFLDYIKHARTFITKTPKTGEHSTRLLYKLTYTQDALWGKKLTK